MVGITISKAKLEAYGFFMFVFLSIFIVIFWCIIFHNINIMTEDSFSYMHFSPTRTLGYPLFLKLISYFDQTYKIATYIQIIFYGCCVSYLSAQFYKYFHSILMAFLLYTSLMLHP